MITVGSYEAKTRLAALLARVEKGERITITRHGVAVAMLVPVETRRQWVRGKIIAVIKEFGRGRELPPGVTVRRLIDEGRRL